MRNKISFISVLLLPSFYLPTVVFPVAAACFFFPFLLHFRRRGAEILAGLNLRGEKRVFLT